MSTDTHPPGRLAIDDADGLLRVRIVNPARYNAMSLSMWEALGQAVRDAQGRDDLRAIVLEGEGERAFVSGADISEFASQRKDPAQIARYDRAVTQAQQALSESAVPTIALVRGICMGGGMGLAPPTCFLPPAPSAAPRPAASAWRMKCSPTPTSRRRRPSAWRRWRATRR